MPRKRSNKYYIDPELGYFSTSLLNKFLGVELEGLPETWSGNISQRYSDAQFCCQIAVNPKMLADKNPLWMTGENGADTGEQGDWDSRMYRERFGLLFSRAPEFVLRLMQRKRPANRI